MLVRQELTDMPAFKRKETYVKGKSSVSSFLLRTGMQILKPRSVPMTFVELIQFSFRLHIPYLRLYNTIQYSKYST